MKTLILAFLVLGLGGIAAAQVSGCRTGASAMAHAYVLANPTYSLVFDESLEDFIGANKAHFAAQGDAIRCADAMATALMGASVMLFDPEEQQRRESVETQLGSLGVPGSPEPSGGSPFFFMSQELSRLVRVLPPAAEGDWGPFQTPETEIEGFQQFAQSMLIPFLRQNPDLMASIGPLLRQLATMDEEALTRLGTQLARHP